MQSSAIVALRTVHEARASGRGAVSRSERAPGWRFNGYGNTTGRSKSHQVLHRTMRAVATASPKQESRPNPLWRATVVYPILTDQHLCGSESESVPPQQLGLGVQQVCQM